MIRVARALSVLLLVLPLVFIPNDSFLDRYGGHDMEEGTFSLTIDDGPGPNTKKILDTLDEAHVKATFFLIGDQAKQHPNLVSMILARGHKIGCHSMSHFDMKRDEDRAKREIDECYDLLGTKLFRFPYGESTPSLEKYVREKGFLAYWWSVDSLDWARKGWLEPTIADMEIVGRGIVLMHEQSCYPSLGRFLSKVRSRGWKWEPLRAYGHSGS